MAGDLVQEISEDFLKCAICMDIYENPKILPCFHTFCETCLEQYARKKGGNFFPCPTCRANANLPDTGVAGLPTNFYIDSLNEKLDRLGKMQAKVEKKEEVTCDECKDSETRIDHICEKCERVFCDNCAETHSRWSFLSGHNVFTINEFKRELRNKSLQKPENESELEMCSQHRKEQAGLFCDTCKVVICFLCTEEAHSRPNHDYKGLQTQCAKTKQALTDMLSESDSMIQKCSSVAEKHFQSLHSINRNALYYKEKIKEESKRMKKAIDEEEKKLLEEVVKFEKHVFHFYQVRIDEISDWRESLDISQNIVKQVLGKSCGKAEFLIDGHYLDETFANMRKHHAKFQKPLELEQIAFAAAKKNNQVPPIGNIWVPQCVGMKATGNGSRDAIVVCEDAASFDIYIGNVLSENGLHLKHIFWFVNFRWPQDSHTRNERVKGKVCCAVNPGNCVFLGQEEMVACFDMVAGTSKRKENGKVCYRTISPITCMDFDESSKLLFIGSSSTRIVAVNPDKGWMLSFFIEIPADIRSPISISPHKYGALFVCESQSMVYEANFKRQCGFLVSCPTAIGGHDFKPVRVFRTLCKSTGNERTTDADLYHAGRKQGHYALRRVSFQLEFAWFVLWVSVQSGKSYDKGDTWAIAEYNAETTNVVAILHQPLGMGIPADIVPFESEGLLELILCDKALGFKTFKRSTAITGTTSSPALFVEV